MGTTQDLRPRPRDREGRPREDSPPRRASLAIWEDLEARVRAASPVLRGADARLKELEASRILALAEDLWSALEREDS